ncbi:aconitate hydratase AcnA [Candidatus Ishikawella capsulata]|nr:aconitate hydratase AcnA [Candidatus Ishikawaella capsulata]
MSLTLREQSKKILTVYKDKYYFYSLLTAAQKIGNIDYLPKSLKIILENLIRWQDGDLVTIEDIEALVMWQKDAHLEREIGFHPVRVLMQDFTGIPAVSDLAAMREAVKRLGGDMKNVNPLSLVDLVIDHSVVVDRCGDNNAFNENVKLEMKRNKERYAFLQWSQKAFNNLRVVPPSTGICHQINLEYLGKTVWSSVSNGERLAYPDTLVGTDSHTTMINAMGILGWGVGGIEAEAAILGQPVSMLIPDVVGFKITGKLRPGITATDLVLTVTQMLRSHGVVGKFVEFYGDALIHLPLVDRATIANMTPEYGATCGFFPIDQITLDYMSLTGRNRTQVDLVEKYAKAQGIWRNSGDEPIFTSTLSLDMYDVESSIAGPCRPQDRIPLHQVPSIFKNFKNNLINKNIIPYKTKKNSLKYKLYHGAIVIAAITSCTSTSNANMLMTAGLLAKKAVHMGLKRKPWVKASLAPGSKVVSNYLNKAGLTPYLDTLGFNLVGYGCTTCIGNTGALLDNIEDIIKEHNLVVSAILSGNRNFPGRIHHLIQTNWLASPPLVIAYALAGNIKINLIKDPLGEDRTGKPIYLKDIWPSPEEIADAVNLLNNDMFRFEYSDIFKGTKEWQQINVTRKIENYNWDENSTYIRLSPFFNKMQKQIQPIKAICNSRVLAILGDSITTDHISPAGNISVDSPAGLYLLSKGVKMSDFNSYGSRRGNYEVMIRGTFANVRLRNEIVPNKEGGYTKHFPSGELLTIYDAAMKYQKNNIPLIIIAGKEYGCGSSRDWAAKGPLLQGVYVVIAESFERIHRSNLIGMGILPLEFPKGVTRKTLQLTGEEYFDIIDLDKIKIRSNVTVNIKSNSNTLKEIIKVNCCIYTDKELNYYRNGGILHYVIRNIL